MATKLTLTGKKGAATSSIGGLPKASKSAKVTGITGAPPFDARKVPAGWAALVANGMVVLARLGEGPALTSGGYGGWEVISRRGRVGLTDYAGRDPLTLTLPLLLDAYAAGGSVEQQRTTLEGMAGTWGVPPVPVPARIYGVGLPHREKRWVINDLSFGDGVEFNAAGQLARQPVTVTLLEHVDGGKLIVSKVKRQHRKAPDGTKLNPSLKRVVVHQGDTLTTIAVAVYGAAKYWKKIAAVNVDKHGHKPIRDPKALRQGQVLKIP